MTLPRERIQFTAGEGVVHYLFRSSGRAILQNRENARLAGRGDRAGGEFPDLQSGVREGAVRLSERALGNAAGGADHFEVQRGTALAKLVQ